MTTASRLRTALLCGGLLALTGLAPAPAEPAARALLDEVVRAYGALPSYTDRGEFVLTLNVDGTSQTQRLPLHLAFARPNKLNLDAGLARIVSDGKTLTTVAAPLQTFDSSPAPARITFDTVFTGGPVGSALFGGPAAPMMSVLFRLLAGDDPAKAVLDLGETLTLEKDREVDGNPCRVLKVASENGPAFLLTVEAKTKLLQSIAVEPGKGGLTETFPQERKARVETYRWTAGAVSTKAPEAAVFAFEPPKGFREVGAAAKADPPAEAAPEFKVQGLLGKPAPDFTLTVLDGPGKTKTVSRADLAGKVVLIDFWATWCGPCLTELPEIQKLIEAYAKAKKDVVVVALSQDDAPKDPAEVRKLIEKTLESKKITLTETPVGKVALDPSNSVGGKFQVEGYPTVVLLDPEGVVRAAHVGFSPEVGAILTKEIDALLAGKPLPGGKAEGAK